MKKTHKKITILYVLKMLEEGSSKNKPITQSVMQRTLQILGVECDRKTISRDIDCLIEFGYDIRKNRGGGCYLVKTELTTNEIEQILDGINLLNITINEKVALKRKVKTLTRKYYI